ncbi:MAG: hypothetical protein JRH11_24470, partial [Deltaproteobacteria bacterium]|nr:hypothetical protein [Deltaproteobacteria bacterium]
MAKKPKPAAKDPNKALAEMERPQVRWKTVALFGLGFVVFWALAIGMMPWTGYWGLGVAGVLSLVAAGFAIYMWRLTKKSQGIVDILKSATDAEGRKAALEQLDEKLEKGDAMAALAKAQLVAQEKPGDAIKVLEGVNIDKAPAAIRDDVRANLGLLYLMHGRAKDARPLADAITFQNQPQPKAKAMYAAVVAEAFARTGKAPEAKNLLETYPATDPAYGEVGAMLYRAQVYTFMATKNRGLAKKAMEALGGMDPNMVAAFVGKGNKPEIQKMAKQVIQGLGMMPKQK